MISDARGFSPLDVQGRLDILAFDKSALRSAKGNTSTIDLQVDGRLFNIRIVTTSTAFGGSRFWFTCSACARRTRYLHQRNMPKPVCRRCAGIGGYEGQRRHREVAWETHGRRAVRLGKVRSLLAKPYLRRDRRRILQQEERRLVEEICRVLGWAGIGTERQIRPGDLSVYHPSPADAEGDVFFGSG